MPAETDWPIATWAIITATLLGPILAVQAQKWVERATERRRRTLWIFHTLLTTRTDKVARDHVNALNSIDFEFSGLARRPIFRQSAKEKAVTDAWAKYRNHLSTFPREDGATKLDDEAMSTLRAARIQWSSKSDDLFVSLLFAMSNCLGCGFSEAQLKTDHYTPQAFGDEFQRQATIQAGLQGVLSGEVPLRVATFQSEEEIKEGTELRRELLTFLRQKNEAAAKPRRTARGADAGHSTGPD